MREEKLYIQDISDCIDRIEDYTRDGRESFMQTRMIQDAVIRNFEIIGEATKRLSQDFRQAYPNIQWQRIAGFRDVLIHDYLRVDLDEVWGIVERNLPELKATIRAILNADEG
ncbi:MAG: DUF86 domain-containing protein [Oscillatoriales cyanobacterium]|uniref:DUF86 domain-containing protein n=1 Tax=Microcoleus anatoxicus PTRS2 TaxID=2705321 RepID=A0ABU8YUV9_9CYAN|nr:MAG: DUF86 domain-containing protein [Oscillatoriales cyanobacterium]TAD99429.1 MAG: DUF86 domain-containing protein [Oscillatoriales cyanobacterium]TAE98444.1 MAG: DUF86 domain-containing protein [Oscillatoriales cyanobacterium]TAF62472.1 MAG: DUF86 domain-containing protein [Oscillatoriales cyanobacterium]